MKKKELIGKLVEVRIVDKNGFVNVNYYTIKSIKDNNILDKSKKIICSFSEINTEMMLDDGSIRQITLC